MQSHPVHRILDSENYLNLTVVLSDITVLLSSILCILTIHQFYGIYLFMLWFNVIRALVLRPTCHIWLASFRTLIWGVTLTKDHFMTPEEVVLHNRDHCIIILIFIHSDAVYLLLLSAHGMSKLSKNTQKNAKRPPFSKMAAMPKMTINWGGPLARSF